MKDPIVEEVRKIRNSYAESLNYNAHAIVKDIRKKQKISKKRIVSVHITQKTFHSAVCHLMGQWGSVSKSGKIFFLIIFSLYWVGFAYGFLYSYIHTQR